MSTHVRSSMYQTFGRPLPVKIGEDRLVLQPGNHQVSISFE